VSVLRPPFRSGGRRAWTRALSKATPRPLKKGDHVYLVDGSGYIFRAYHALPPLTRKSDGLPTGALAGFCNMLWKLLGDMKAGDKPSHLAVIFDAGRASFRNDIYPEYKANRSETPEDLIPQFPLVRDATRAFNVPAIEMAGFEADDLIATYARQAREAGAKVTIVSSDKDLMQLIVDGSVEMFDPMKAKRIASAEVVERDRREDGGGAHRRLWRPGNASQTRERNQAAEAARDAHEQYRERAHFGKACAVGRQHDGRCRHRGIRLLRSRSEHASAVPGKHGTEYAAETREP
jgi:hypothetical protein